MDIQQTIRMSVFFVKGEEKRERTALKYYIKKNKIRTMHKYTLHVLTFQIVLKEKKTLMAAKHSYCMLINGSA